MAENQLDFGAECVCSRARNFSRLEWAKDREREKQQNIFYSLFRIDKNWLSLVLQPEFCCFWFFFFNNEYEFKNMIFVPYITGNSFKLEFVYYGFLSVVASVWRISKKRVESNRVEFVLVSIFKSIFQFFFSCFSVSMLASWKVFRKINMYPRLWFRSNKSCIL